MSLRVDILLFEPVSKFTLRKLMEVSSTYSLIETPPLVECHKSLDSIKRGVYHVGSDSNLDRVVVNFRYSQLERLFRVDKSQVAI